MSSASIGERLSGAGSGFNLRGRINCPPRRSHNRGFTYLAIIPHCRRKSAPVTGFTSALRRVVPPTRPCAGGPGLWQISSDGQWSGLLFWNGACCELRWLRAAQNGIYISGGATQVVYQVDSPTAVTGCATRVILGTAPLSNSTRLPPSEPNAFADSDYEMSPQGAPHSLSRLQRGRRSRRTWR